MAQDFSADVKALEQIDAVPTLLKLVCRTTGMGFAAIARVTESRWVCLAVHDEIEFGLTPGGELKVETTICHEIRQSGRPVIIENVADDKHYAKHHTPALYGLQSYIAMPIVLKDGSFFGTLCAIDPRPAKITPDIVEMFRVFAGLVSFHLNANLRLADSEATLRDERTTSRLREQFIAVLGHDLRNPLASIAGGLQLVLKTPLNEKAIGFVGMMQQSVTRMSGLIDDVLDFARGQLGSGLSMDKMTAEDIGPIIEQVVDELLIGQPGHIIDMKLAVDRSINCDRRRIGQLFSNLIGNALTYGTPNAPVRIRACTDETSFEFSVSNSGSPIPQATIEQLFAPFTRGTVGPNRQGLGLGLFIASEVARAHGGK